MKALTHWLLSALVILVLANILPGVKIEGFFTALAVSLVLGIINVLLRPVLLLLTLPLNILTLGLLTFIIDTLLVLLAAAIVPGFSIASFWWALIFGLLLGLINPVRNSRGVFRSPPELFYAIVHAAKRRGIISNGINIVMKRWGEI